MVGKSKRPRRSAGALIAHDILSGSEGERAMRYYLSAREKGEPPPKWVMAFLEDAFRKIVIDGADLKTGLQMKRRRGRHDAGHKHFDIATRYLALRDNGASYRDALELLEREFECKERTITKAISHYRQQAGAIRHWLRNIERHNEWMLTIARRGERLRDIGSDHSSANKK